MITLFRKIRQKLLAENNIGKYLKYAIGEIILVVIGILIALQINNWNEHQKKLTSANEHLRLLKDNIEVDLVQLEDLKNKIDTCLLFAGKLSRQFKMIDTIDKYTPHYIMSAILEYRFNPNRNAIDVLNNSGEFTVLNDELQTKLFHYYTLVEKIEVREEISNTFIKNRYEPYFFEYYNEILNKNNPWAPAYQYYKDDLRLSKPFDKIKFLQDKQLEAMVFGRTFQMKQQIVLYREAIEVAHQILLEINAF